LVHQVDPIGRDSELGHHADHAQLGLIGYASDASAPKLFERLIQSLSILLRAVEAQAETAGEPRVAVEDRGLPSDDQEPNLLAMECQEKFLDIRRETHALHLPSACRPRRADRGTDCRMPVPSALWQCAGARRVSGGGTARCPRLQLPCDFERCGSLSAPAGLLSLTDDARCRRVWPQKPRPGRQGDCTRPTARGQC
jgi:hypothetical protein